MTTNQLKAIEAIKDYDNQLITSEELEDILQGLSLLEVIELGL